MGTKDLVTDLNWRALDTSLGVKLEAIKKIVETPEFFLDILKVIDVFSLPVLLYKIDKLLLINFEIRILGCTDCVVH